MKPTGTHGTRRVFLLFVLAPIAGAVLWGWSRLSEPILATAPERFTHTSEIPTAGQERRDSPFASAIAKDNKAEKVSEVSADCIHKMELAEVISDPFQRRSKMLDAFSEWTKRDLEGALAWFGQLPARLLGNEVDAYLIDALLSKGGIAALELLDASESPLVNETLKNKFIMGLAEQDPRQAAIELILIPPDRRTLSAAVAHDIIQKWLRKSPEDGRRLIATLPAGWERDEVYVAAAQAWSGLNVEKTSVWVEGLLEGPAKDAALHQVTQSWADQNVAASIKWMRSLPANRTRDVVILTLCEKLGDVYPKELSTWVSQIKDAEIRKSATLLLEPLDR